VSRRSVSNDRYRVENKGKTRKSASSAKPKREAGVGTSAAVAVTSAGKSAKTKTSWWSRVTRPTQPAIPTTPEMKKLRRVWWSLMVAAVLIALAMIPASSMKNRTLDYALIGGYAVVLGTALYLEFGPLRKARMAAIASAKKSSKSGGKNAAKPVGGKGGAKA
jgi:hypothetical protein